MKQLKHIKLFEAFESVKLGKTLSFINSSAKSTFIDNLKRIAKNYDFPISKFNDDMFQYLPFKSALRKNVDPPKPTEREVCKRESDWIPGEFCQGGRVKRTWGSHTRMTECPGCGGTGFKPEKKVAPEVQLLKFWFDKDGNYVTVTGCDGQIRKQFESQKNADYSGELYNFSKNNTEIKPIPEEEAYTWNNLIDIRYMQMNNVKDMDVRLKNAHFAIILDLNKLKEAEYEKVSGTQTLRKQRKEGAFLKPEEIKKANLERYISLLVKKFDASKGLSEIPKILPRALGFTNSITFILRGINFNNLESLVSYLYDMMKVNARFSPDDAEYYQKNALNTLNNIYDQFNRKGTTTNQNIDGTWQLLDKSTDKEMKEKMSRYFETYLELGEMINKKITSTKIENISDIEVLLRKFINIRDFVGNTRLHSLRELRYLSEYLYSGNPNSVYSCIRDIVEDSSDSLEDLAQLRRAIEQILG